MRRIIWIKHANVVARRSVLAQHSTDPASPYDQA